jgi:hypothetical protein
MSATATTPPRAREGREHRARARRQPGCQPEPGRATLDDRITAVWTRLVETGEAECPVCTAGIATGRPCGACGSELT